MPPSHAYTISVAGWFGVISSDYNRLEALCMHSAPASRTADNDRHDVVCGSMRTL